MQPTIGIRLGRNLSVGEVGGRLPSMRRTITGWFRPLVLGRIIETIKDLQVVQKVTQVKTYGTIQPFSAQQLKLKPEGERSWKWWMLHVLPETQIKLGEYFWYQGSKYRTMSDRNYSEYGYVEYELVQDYNDSANPQ